MQSEYIYHQDPGHGWVAVPLAELERLGIADQISVYSYQRGKTAYLEEDCDAPLWQKAKLIRGEPVTLIDSYRDPTPIRQYDHYHTEDHHAPH